MKIKNKKIRQKVFKIKSENGNFEWIVINNAGQEEISFLKENYTFHALDLEDCLSEIQRPKIDDYKNYLFMVMHFPIKKKNSKYIQTNEVNAFIGQDYVIILHNNNPIIESVFSKCKNKNKIKNDYMSKGSGYFLYMLIDDLFESLFPVLDRLSKQISELEADVFDSGQSKDRLKDILTTKKDIINLRRIMMPQRAVIAQLEHKNKKFLPDNLDIYFDDTVDKTERIWNILENQQELIVSVQEINESIISHTTNNIMRILTIFSVIMLPLTFITGFYGMNINTLPYANSDASLFIITSFILAVSLTMLAYFKYKKWL